jgi:acetoin:2,6-dichlorophenolindophenol oxidoreductase subunit alpha
MSHIATNKNPESLLEVMLLIRAFELNNISMQASGKAPGTCTSVGQEASAAGVIRALGPEDLILTNHRSAAHLLARGADPGRVLAEIMGRSDGYCKGKSGSLHISVKELGVILTSTIVGGELSLAPGVALSQSVLGKNGIVTVFFGDGAACEGIFHESLNLASVWNLPILYVCENNQWQAFVHRRETMGVEYISDWPLRYGIHSMTVDGNDVDAVFAAAKHARDSIRETGKPVFIEAYTYRMRGHFEPDDQSYVDPLELSAWAAKDPIERYKSKLLREGLFTPNDLTQMEQRVKETIERANDFARSSPFPDANELLTDVYA